MTGIVHTVCTVCRRTRGWRAYDAAAWHAVLTRDGRLRCRWCREPTIALLDDDEREESVA